MLETVLTIPFWLELAAALTGGLSGAARSVDAEYDIFGTVCIACVAGLAGGIMRDILLQKYGIYAFQNPEFIIACAAAAVAVFYFKKVTNLLDPFVRLLDTLSVGLWAVISAGKGLSAGLGVVPSIILGTITAVGGGILRDLLMNRKPEVFQAGPMYGSAALLGSAAFALMKQHHLLEQYAAITCVAIVVLVRYLSVKFGWHTTPPHDYTDAVAEAVTKPVAHLAERINLPKGKVAREKELGSNQKEERDHYEKLRAFWKKRRGESDE